MWLSANKQSSSDTTTMTLSATRRFEIVPEFAVPTGAYFTEEADSDTGDGGSERHITLRHIRSIRDKENGLRAFKSTSDPPPLVTAPDTSSLCTSSPAAS